MRQYLPLANHVIHYARPVQMVQIIVVVHASQMRLKVVERAHAMLDSLKVQDSVLLAQLELIAP